ncbi:sulfite reductase subunit alpha [Undibacterium oligocarboniphilum]|uniref:NADPH--hemoprotein reductase n=1 Tax=Undibacterium oligocarboniphilum TaxID=666702 RepID=A0A850QFI0_9BURK|nr:sulfite reductase subunit alpha [Undibacterium oligocarboniphilum]MBC3869571.1 flavodoxin domain-containing protein [Undibacterium oligocarboniphilum]NVO77949.1 flavodoxin domain-containing protein [Undibacterium oligocarboniphilum]
MTSPLNTAFTAHHLHLLSAAGAIASIASLTQLDSGPGACPAWLCGLLVGATYLIFCLSYWRQYQEQQHPLQIASATTDQPVTDIVLIAYASQTGYAQQLAHLTAASLQQAGLTVALRTLNQLSAEALTQYCKILFVVSTTGEGDAPDQASLFCRRILPQQQDLSHLHYAVLALGDRHYSRYCAFGHQLRQWLAHQQAQALFDLVEVDNGDEAALRHWQHHLNHISGDTGLADWSTPAYGAWILRDRHLLNPGSAGQPVFHLQLIPPAGSNWQAGDIAEIGPGELPGSGVTSAVQTLPSREYSIASLPSDGGLELAVRQMRHPDGRLGTGSGWLTEQVQPGQAIALRVRSNPSFHTPLSPDPLLLIGNGTGIAGLRAHLKARAAAGLADNWLVFGERQRAHDYFFQTEVEHWLRQGTLSRLDLCFSRDQTQRRYVQHALLEQTAEVKRWAERGATILVCGSLHGMAAGVHAALLSILGETLLDTLTQTGRYRRDVY